MNNRIGSGVGSSLALAVVGLVVSRLYRKTSRANHENNSGRTFLLATANAEVNVKSTPV